MSGSPGILDLADVPAAILAGGLATRLRPLTDTIPKALVEVAGRPFIEHQLALLRRNGIRRAVLCLGYRGREIQARLQDGAALGLDLQYSYDGDVLLGTAGALRRALPLLGRTFWVLYGDSYTDVDFAEVLADLSRRRGLGIMTVLRNEGRWDRSNVVFRDGRLLRYDKRTPTHDMTYIDHGVAVLRREALERVPEGKPHDLADLYAALVGEGLLAGFEVFRRFYEIGSAAGLEETRAFLESQGSRESS